MLPDEIMSERLTEIKNALLTLKATGGTGFEGLVRTALAALTGIPFRLAASGLQGGIDGDSALPSDAVCFEAKRYSGNIPRTEVLPKIIDLARNKDAPDRLWILGATTEVSAQLASDVRIAGNQHAISTLILDWGTDSLPLLAVAVVAAGDAAIDFLVTYGDSKLDRTVLTQTFKDISKHPDYDALLQKLRSNLNVSTLATARSIELNKKWREDTFGSASIARERLGQALAVISKTDLPSLRIVQRDQVKQSLQAVQTVVLSGAEGHGKSWLAAQTCCDHEGLALFASAEQFDDVVPQDLDEFLIGLLIKQTGDISDETTNLRWRHRLAAWRNEPPMSSLLVVVDGINQRQSIRWDRLLNGLQEKLQAIGGHLIVTVRPQFWQKSIFPGVIFKPKLIKVPEWSCEERNQLLSHYGINLDWLDQATLLTLCNPRLLGVAVATMPHQNSAAWKGLTTDRLLMEHLRASQRENFEEETLHALTARISNHARVVLKQVRASANELPKNFAVDSTAVIETRFFLSQPGPGDTYVLREEGLTLALGYALIDQIWQAHTSNLDLALQMAHLIDPISAMDRTVDVMFAALMVCALDPIRFERAIFAVLLDAFSNLQNINDQRFEQFVEIVKCQPTEFFDALGIFTLEKGPRLNQDWFVHAAFEIANTDEGWVAAEMAIHRWLHCYNKDAVEQTNRYPKHDEVEDKKHLERTRNEIEKVLSSLSPYESGLLEKMTEISGDSDSLLSLALQLLAGRPLAGFANSFIALNLGFSLDRGVWSSRKAFSQLTTFSRVDRELAEAAFLKAIEPLRCSNPSLSGQWTVVRMLYATGNEMAAHEASTIASSLSEDNLHWNDRPVDEWRQSRVSDPNAIRPKDIDAGLHNFNAIQPDRILQSMGPSKEDLDLRTFLPIACRFAPNAAIEKIRAILVGLLKRTALPLRQLIFNGAEYSPLMTRDMTIQLVARAIDSNTNMVETFIAKEQNFLRMYLFIYVVSQLTPSEQLERMMDLSFGSDYLLQIIPQLKPQSTEAILDALQVALDVGDEESTYGVLAAARYGNTPITPELESLLLQCSNASSSRLRALSFERAIHCGLNTIRDAHVQSGWSAIKTDRNIYENWYGSLLLAEACVKKELAIEKMLTRIHPETWFSVAKYVGSSMSKPLADLFLNRLQGAVKATVKLVLPAADFVLSTYEPVPFPFLSVDETDRGAGRFPQQGSIKDFFKKEEDIAESQDRLNEISDAFFEELKGSDARLFAERLSIDDIKMLVDTDFTILPQLLEMLEKMSPTQFTWVKNIAFIVANLASKNFPERSVILFQQTLAIQSFVTYAFEDGLTLEHEAIWSSSSSTTMNTLWRTRLLTASNDEILSREVVAAERFGACAFIKAFVKEFSESTSTLDNAYAISVAGYSTQFENIDGLIKGHLEDKGIVGGAAKKAKTAHDEAQWAKKWLSDMCSTQSVEEFWRCLIIAKTCMDARTSADILLNTQWSHYASLFIQIRKAAIKEQNKKREKTLLGQPVPDKIFIAGK